MTDPTPDYTAISHGTALQRLLDNARNRFAKHFNEVAESSTAMMFFESVAWLHEQRSFYYNRLTINVYLETADLPEAIIGIARQLGYKRRQSTGSSVPVTLYPVPARNVQITIPAGTKILVEDLAFTAGDTYVIPAGKTVWPDDTTEEIIIFVQGEQFEETFVSDGSRWQKFTLSREAIIQDSISIIVDDEPWEETESLIFIEGTGRGRDVFIGDGTENQSFTLSLNHAIISEDNFKVLVNGTTWQLVTAFTGAPQEYVATIDGDGITTLAFGRVTDSSAPPDLSTIDVLYQISGPQKRYIVDFSPEGLATVGFGDGESGIIPPTGTTINITYRVSGGVKGNISRGQMDSVIRGDLPSGAQTNVRVINSEKGSGAEDAESLDSVKFRAPRYAQSNQRAVTTQDWVVLASSYHDDLYGAPAYAAAKLKQLVPERNTVQVILWSRDDQGRISTASTPLKHGVESYLSTLHEPTVRIEMVDGEVLFFDIFATVVLSGGKSVSSVTGNVSEALRTFFGSNLVVPGADLIMSHIADIILETNNILAVTMDNVIGSKLRVVDLGTGDGASALYTTEFPIPSGVEMVPGSFLITGGTQTITDDGEGNLEGDLDGAGTNTISYTTGKAVVTFEAAPDVTDFIEAECRVYAELHSEEESLVTATNELSGQTKFKPILQRRPYGVGDGVAVSGFLPQVHTPYEPNRVVFLAGYDYYGIQPGGQLFAIDDGSGNIIGDVTTGSINYETGEFSLNWNTTPAPGGTTDYWGRLLVAPDGSNKTFNFEARTASGGGGSQVSFQTLLARGRLKFLLSELSTPNVVFADGWDNARGQVDGLSLDTGEENIVEYFDGLGYTSGTLHFWVAPEVAAGQDFRIQVAPTTMVFYSTFVAYLLGSGVYDMVLPADDNGRFITGASNAYPYACLDQVSGRFEAQLSATVSGRRATVTYDTRVESYHYDIPVDALVMPTFNSVQLAEGTASE